MLTFCSQGWCLGKVVAGGSTISQQLAKNLFLTPPKTPWRKAQEAVITLMLELLCDKRRILEVYLNSVEWGDGIFGAEAAARRYEKNPYLPFVNERTQVIHGRMQYAEVP